MIELRHASCGGRLSVDVKRDCLDAKHAARKAQAPCPIAYALNVRAKALCLRRRIHHNDTCHCHNTAHRKSSSTQGTCSHRSTPMAASKMARWSTMGCMHIGHRGEAATVFSTHVAMQSAWN